MSMRWLNAKSALISSMILATSLVVPPAFAGGGGGGSIVYDPWNYAENSVTAAQTVKQLETQVEQYAMQKYGINVNLKNLPQSVLQKLIAKYPPTNQYQMNYLSDLQALEHQLGITSSSLQQQYKAYSASGLTPGQYVQQEQKIANSNQAYSASEYKQAIAAMKRSDTLAKAVKSQGEKIGNVKGTSAEMNLLNTQMHTLIQQNQMLIKLVASNDAAKGQNGSHGATAVKRNAQYLKGVQSFLSKQPTMKQQEAKAFNNLGNLKPHFGTSTGGGG